MLVDIDIFTQALCYGIQRPQGPREQVIGR